MKELFVFFIKIVVVPNALVILKKAAHAILKRKNLAVIVSVIMIVDVRALVPATIIAATIAALLNLAVIVIAQGGFVNRTNKTWKNQTID